MTLQPKEIEMNDKITARHLEIIAARHFNYRTNLIVPNISWGLGLNYEADLLVVNDRRFVKEIEIKISFSDLKADISKNKFIAQCFTEKIKQFYYLISPNLEKRVKDILDIIPEFAGLLLASEISYSDGKKYFRIKLIKSSKVNRRARPLSSTEYNHLLHLASMRIWTLKEHLNKV
jgi:hypothetical protein